MWNYGWEQNNCECCNKKQECCCGQCCKKEEKKEFICHCEEKKDDCNKNYGCSNNQYGYGMYNY